MKVSVPYTSVTGIPVDCIDLITEMRSEYASAAECVRKYSHHDGKYKMVFITDGQPTKELKEVQDALDNNCAFVIPYMTLDGVKKYLNEGLNLIYGYSCSSWQELNSVSSIGFKEATISPSMAMEAKRLAKIKSEIGIEIRTQANVARTNSALDDKSPKSFWIRPEAIALYEGIIDTIELTNLEVLPFYLRQQSPKNLDNLIAGLPAFTANENYRRLHDITRLNCGMACRAGTVCGICQ